MNKDSKQLQESLDEQKVGQMVDRCLEEVFSKFNPNNAEIAVFACIVTQMMLGRAIDMKADFPKKMSIGAPSGHTITLEIRKPTTNTLDVANQLLRTH